MADLVYPTRTTSMLGYGMPHIGCRYTRDDVSATAFDDSFVPCAVCGAKATNRHHEPPRGLHSATDEDGTKRPGALLMLTDWGRFILKPALIALCGSGTQGCHGRRHNREIGIEWTFDTPEYEEQWASGYLLAHGWLPHTERLYGIGCWHFTADGRTWEHRGGGY